MEVTIHIPGAIGPVDRGRLFEDPLGAALQGEGVGKVGDSGTQMGVVDGKYVVAGCDIHVTLDDVERGLTVIRRVLTAAGAPAATTITEGTPEKKVHRL